MGLFTRKHGQDAASEVASSTTKAIPAQDRGLLRIIRRALKKEGPTQPGSESVSLASSSDQARAQRLEGSRSASSEVEPNAPTSSSLWDRAYDALRDKEPKLVDEYEALLSQELQETSAVPSDASSPQLVPPNAINGDTEKQSRRAQLDTITKAGLQRMDGKRKKYTIGSHEFVLTDQISQVTDLVVWAKTFIGEAVKSSPEASIAWAGISIVLPLLTNHKTANEANRDGFTFVTTRMRYFAAFESTLLPLARNVHVDPELTSQINAHVVDLYQHILDFQTRSILRFYQASLKKVATDVIKSEIWKQMTDKIKVAEATVTGELGQMKAYVSTRELESINATTSESLESMKRLLSAIETQVRLQEETRDLQREQLEFHRNVAKQKLSEEEEKCHQLFRLTDNNNGATYEWYKNRVEDRVEGTCQWFLSHEEYQRWLKLESGLLLVSADPGCGKSVLAKHLIEHKLPRSATICYFFFKDQDQNTTSQALCALLHQLFSHQPSLIRHAMPEFSKNGSSLTKVTDSLWSILHKAGQDSEAGPVIIVLDALDECLDSDFEDLTRNVKFHVHNSDSTQGKMKYLLTCRPYESITSNFQDLLDDFPYVRIPGEEESDSISQEVNRVIEYRAEQLARKKGLSNEVKDRLTCRLLEVPHRTYLWVYLVFDYLDTEHFKKTPKGLMSAMTTLPQTVNQAYEKILNRAKDREMVSKVLSMILGATRPLTVAEMNVAVNTNDALCWDDLDLEREEDFKASVRSLCGLFVSIYHGKIYLLHQTAREFLLKEVSQIATCPSSLGWQGSITTLGAHTVLARVCVIYLGLFDSVPTLMGEDEQAEAYFAFRFYSAENWGTHVRKARLDDHALILSICDPNSNSYSTWTRIFKGKNGPLPKNFSNLMVACFFGHDAVVQHLLARGADVEERDSRYGQTPLSWAAYEGHIAIVQQLIENGADFEVPNTESGCTPLLSAMSTGRNAGTPNAIHNKVDIETKNKDGRTPLLLAVNRGHEVIVQLLLAKGADIRVRDMYGTSPLLGAVVNGYEAIVQLLIAQGADINAEDSGGRSALSLAVLRENEAVVQLLIAKGADIEAKDNLGTSPLLWAAGNGYEAIVQLLIAQGADVNAEDSGGRSALSLAVLRENEAVVQLLIANGADIEAKDMDGRSSLFSAVEKGHIVVVRLLIANGADIEAKDRHGRSPLNVARAWAVQKRYVLDGKKSWAARKRHWLIEKLLIAVDDNVEIIEDEETLRKLKIRKLIRMKMKRRKLKTRKLRLGWEVSRLKDRLPDY